MQVTIDRSKWQRGEGVGQLLDRCDGMKCAVGFIALAAGYRPSDLHYEGELPRGDEYEMDEFLDKFPVKLERKLEEINDDPDIDDDEREEKLGNIAREAGIELVFVN